jgi:hypothetical protein
MIAKKTTTSKEFVEKMLDKLRSLWYYRDFGNLKVYYDIGWP